MEKKEQQLTGEHRRQGEQGEAKREELVKRGQEAG